MVRLLKEENGDLKKMIEDLSKKLSLGIDKISDEDRIEFQDLKEQFDANNRQMEDMRKLVIKKKLLKTV